MSQYPTEFEDADLSGARFRKVQLNDARFRMVDLTGAILRDVSLSGAEIDGELDGLRINGVEVAPLIEAELDRREPARVLLHAAAPGPDEFRAAWAALATSWQATYDRVAALPADAVDRSVEGEWSFAQTLRHLIFATDAWLGGINGVDKPFHPWGVPFTELHEFMQMPEELDVDAAPSYADVLEVRMDRVARVRDFLAGVTAERLDEECGCPAWEGGRRLSVRRCLRVIVNEECEHHRFAQRDLDVIAAG